MRAVSRTWRQEIPRAFRTKFRASVDIHEAINCVKFGDDSLKGLGVTRGTFELLH